MTSVITTLRAPACLHTAAAMAPMGPAPVISTSSPSRGHCRAVCTALPKGSNRAATSRSMPGECSHTLDMGRARYSANAPGPVDPDAAGVGAQVAPAGHAVAAAPAHHVALAGDDLARVEVDDVGPHRHDLADKLVAHHHGHRDGLLRPGVPVVDVHVGAADRGAPDLDQDVVDARGPARGHPPARGRGGILSSPVLAWFSPYQGWCPSAQ